MKLPKLRGSSGYLLLAGLCLLLSTRWMFLDAWPQTQSRLSSQAFAAAILCVACVGFAYLRPKARRPPERWSGSAAVGGLLLFAGLNAGQIAGPMAPRDTDLLIGMALAPIVIAIVLSTEGAGNGLSATDLVPGLLAAAGLLLILRQPSLGRPKADLVLLAAPFCAGTGAVWLACHHTRQVTAKRAAVAFGGAAILFAYFARKPPYSHPTVAATVLDLLAMALAMGAVATVGVQRFAAQFAVVPLLFLLEGLVLEHVRPSWVQLSGLLLLTLAAGWMLFVRRTEARESISLSLS